MADSKLKVFDYVDQLNHLAETAKKVPLSNLIMVDKQSLKQLVQRVESSIDPDIRTAQEVLATEKEIKDAANQQAEQARAEAEQYAKHTTEDANTRAQAALQEAQARAAEMSRDAADKANAMVADAQARAAAIVADAQARADQLVADDQITQRATAEAAQLVQQAHMDCDQYRQSIMNAIYQTLDRADVTLGGQLDQLRQLRQTLEAPAEAPVE